MPRIFLSFLVCRNIKKVEKHWSKPTLSG